MGPSRPSDSWTEFSALWVGRILGVSSLLAGGLYLILVLGHHYTASADAARILVPLAATTSGIYFSIALVFKLRSELAFRHPHAILSFLGILGLVNSLVNLVLMPDPIQTTNLMLLQIAFGALFLSVNHFASLTILNLAGWGLIAFHHGIAVMSDEWIHFGFALVTSTAVSLMILLARVRNLKANIELRAQEQESQFRLVLAERWSALGQMAAGVGHEMNNPITIILLAIHQQILQISCLKALLPSESPALKTLEGVERNSQRIEATATRISTIIRGLLALARYDHALGTQRCKPADVFSDVLAIFRSKMSDYHINLRAQTPPPELEVACPASHLGQAMINVLNNAFDAVCNQKERWITMATEETPTQASIVITDSGPGIPRELKTRIMQPFFSTKPEGKGVGLGLSISKTLIETNGGTFALDPASKHTRFILTLPKAVPSAASTASSRSA